MTVSRIGFGILFALVISMTFSIISVNPSFAQTPGTGLHGPPLGWTAHPPIHVKKSGSATPTGLSPAQIRHAYGLDQLTCYSDNSCGSGQTIAIVDAYDDPYLESDLATFSSQYGLPSCTTTNGCLTIVKQGSPTTNTGWGLEESLDIQWAHAIAPGAKIVLVEAKNNFLSSLLSAVDSAAIQPGVHQVSMSWGGGEFSGESSYDYHFNVAGVSFTASSGDNGHGVSFPAVSPYVVGVGGTDLDIATLTETAWSGSGGGVSAYEPVPSYQIGFNNQAGRGVPDVSYDGGSVSAVSVYDSFGYGGWNSVYGTSVGAPNWAAIIAVINSQRSTPLSSASFGTDTSLYNAASASYTSYYRDTVSGNNGACGSICNAGAGYDFVTGLGSPLSNNLIPYVAPPPSPDFTLSATNVNIQAGISGSSIVTATSLNGYSGTVTLSATAPTNWPTSFSINPVTLASNSASSSLSITVPANTAAGSYSVSVTGTDTTGLSHTTTLTVQVTVPDFSISANPTSLSFKAGGSQSSTIAVSSIDGFSDTISLSAISSSSSLNAALSPTSVSLASGGSSTSTLTVSGSTTGSYTVTVTGTSSSGLSHSVSISVTVTKVHSKAGAH